MHINKKIINSQGLKTWEKSLFKNKTTESKYWYLELLY